MKSIGKKPTKRYNIDYALYKSLYRRDGKFNNSWLKEFRDEKLITRSELAEVLKSSVDLITHIECGWVLPNVDFLFSFKNVFRDYDMNKIFNCLLKDIKPKTKWSEYDL